jgi:hypothetical protein
MESVYLLNYAADGIYLLSIHNEKGLHFFLCIGQHNRHFLWYWRIFLLPRTVKVVDDTIIFGTVIV